MTTNTFSATWHAIWFVGSRQEGLIQKLRFKSPILGDDCAENATLRANSHLPLQR